MLQSCAELDGGGIPLYQYLLLLGQNAKTDFAPARAAAESGLIVPILPIPRLPARKSGTTSCHGLELVGSTGRRGGLMLEPAGLRVSGAPPIDQCTPNIQRACQPYKYVEGVEEWPWQGCVVLGAQEITRLRMWLRGVSHEQCIGLTTISVHVSNVRQWEASPGSELLSLSGLPLRPSIPVDQTSSLRRRSKSRS